MSDQPYRVEVGKFVCHVIPDGSRPTDFDGLQNRLSSADPEELRTAFDEHHPEGSFPWSYNPLLVHLPNRTILFDSSFGATNQHVAALTSGDGVTDVVITHTHGDHVNGLIDEDGNAVYPDAQVWIQKAEWEWWSEENIKSAASAKLQHVEGEAEIIPGITMLPAPGHTPGHIAVMVESDGDRYLHLVDTLHAPVQMARPDWSIRFDSDMALAEKTRKEMLALAAREGVRTQLYHFAFPGLGYVRAAGDGFVWESIS